MAELTPNQREVLRALVDTAVPSLQVEDDPYGFWRLSGSDVGADVAMEQAFGELPEADQVGMAQLLDGLAMLGFQHQGRNTREGMLGTAMALAPEALIAISTLRGASCLLAHSIPDENGQNPFWKQYGYPGPQVQPPSDEPYIRPHVPTDGEVLEADVVVVGSGAGGGTIAGVLATQGKKVVVLEAGRATSERDYRGLEIEASQTMMYRGGIAVSADGNIGLLAGATLGGGTTINWHNCVKPSAEVRREWAGEFGLTDVDSPEFDRHLEAVLARMKANDRCSDFNGPHQRMAEGAKALGWSMHTAVRNVDPETYDPVAAGRPASSSRPRCSSPRPAPASSRRRSSARSSPWCPTTAVTRRRSRWRTARRTACRAPSGPPTATGRWPSPGGCGPGRSASTAACSTRRRRSAASARAATDGSSVRSASRSSRT